MNGIFIEERDREREYAHYLIIPLENAPTSKGDSYLCKGATPPGGV